MIGQGPHIESIEGNGRTRGIRSDQVGKLGLKPLPVALFALTQGASVAAVALAFGLEPAVDTLGFALVGLTMAGAGALVASRRPENRIGWIFLAIAILGAITDALQGYGLRGAEAGWTGALAAQWIDSWLWIPFVLGWALIFMVFPDGHFASRRSRAVFEAGVLTLPIATVGWAIHPDRSSELASSENPFAVAGPAPDALVAVGMSALMGVLIAAIVATIARFRRSEGIERQQMKWIAFAAGANGVVLPAALLVGFYSSPLMQAATVLTFAFLPVAACIAILRHRLYDIDAVIGRTLAYGALTVTLAAVYIATALVVGTGLGAGTAWTTAAATLAAVAVFRPLRMWLQDAVDRRFNRSSYAAQQRIGTFLEALRAGRAAPESIEPLLREVLGESRLELLFPLPESEAYVDVRGMPAGGSDRDSRERTVVSRAGVPIALLLHDSDSERSGDLNDVVEAAGLAFEIARLRADLRRHLDEVTASRARIVAAGDEERRRIERNLHDGAQQRLVSIGLALRRAQHELNGSSHAAQVAIDEAVGEIGSVIRELRELARGLRPSQLDAGLAAALDELAARAPVLVEVVATRERLPEVVEVAAYFVAAEGLTNAIKHSGAERVRLATERTNGRLVVSVTDDGAGGADLRRGSGLAGLADRVEAQGGELEVTSGPAGTRLTAELPYE